MCGAARGRLAEPLGTVCVAWPPASVRVHVPNVPLLADCRACTLLIDAYCSPWAGAPHPFEPSSHKMYVAAQQGSLCLLRVWDGAQGNGTASDSALSINQNICIACRPVKCN